jgi:hypothetical protein
LDVERPRRSTAYFEKTGEWHQFVREGVIFDPNDARKGELVELTPTLEVLIPRLR